MKKWIKIEGRERRRKIIRKKVAGTPERPRLSVRRSLSHMYAQIIDDSCGKTLVALSTLSPDVKEKAKKDCGNVKGAVLLGSAIAEASKKAGVTKVVFDRAGYLYHGRVKALAEAARKGGLQF
ncbi:MAG: 50S ribosomal protein L18 [Candidatus Omnitrophica bacterium]|nr:50S ribosomal protein L18 [Candidatus Omnitrophota bacterium]MBU0895817.1 50S ribosomal protein L18 [Candidatus Omnitrophota bacterium]MBU1037842.1 50S ribosomal protein L18 [Candidatus Omnitrophota bacterium]MBU1808293.1 50S ribosomal protein L18 [Candidatus Omnitrophota bacterium]